MTASFLPHGLDGLHDRESHVVDALLSNERDFRKYYSSLLKEMDVQRKATEQLWHLTQRYMIVMSTDANCKCPDSCVIGTEESIIGDYNINYQIIMTSNKIQHSGIHALRTNVLRFRQYCKELDLTQETPFIRGDAFHKPIKYFMELVEELFNFFHSGHLKLDYSAHQLEPLDLKALEHYRTLLQHNEEFEDYLMSSLNYCKCLRPPDLCPPSTRVEIRVPETKPKERRLHRTGRRLTMETAADSASHHLFGNIPSTEHGIHGLQSLLTMSIGAFSPKDTLLTKRYNLDDSLGDLPV